MMQKIKLTVFFDAPFWVGVCERICGGKLEVCKITFGTEPKDYEVLAFLLQHWHEFRFSPPIAADAKGYVRINPKRMQRAIQKQLEARGSGERAHQALKLQQQAGKQARKVKTRQQKEDECERRFELRQQKRKQKHRGR